MTYGPPSLEHLAIPKSADCELPHPDRNWRDANGLCSLRMGDGAVRAERSAVAPHSGLANGQATISGKGCMALPRREANSTAQRRPPAGVRLMWPALVVKPRRSGAAAGTDLCAATAVRFAGSSTASVRCARHPVNARVGQRLNKENTRAIAQMPASTTAVHNAQVK